MSGLFGGSKSSSTQTSTPVDMTPRELRAIRGPFADTIQRLLGSMDGDPLAGIPSFGQPMVAPIGAAETEGLDVLRSMMGGPASQLINRTLGGEFLTPDTNPFLQAMIQAAQRPTLQGLEETLSRVLPGRFTQAGQFTQPQGSSAFDRAAAIATRGAADAMADIATNIGGQAFEAERGRQQQAIQLSQQEVQSTIQNLQAQALPRLIEDLGIERGLAEFQTRIQAVLQALGVTTGAPMTTIANQGQATSSQKTSPNIFGNLVSAFSAGFPAGI